MTVFSGFIYVAPLIDQYGATFDAAANVIDCPQIKSTYEIGT
jgi:hypothetical protein